MESHYTENTPCFTFCVFFHSYFYPYFTRFTLYRQLCRLLYLWLSISIPHFPRNSLASFQLLTVFRGMGGPQLLSRSLNARRLASFQCSIWCRLTCFRLCLPGYFLIKLFTIALLGQLTCPFLRLMFETVQLPFPCENVCFNPPLTAWNINVFKFPVNLISEIVLGFELTHWVYQ